MGSLTNPKPWVPYINTKDCSQGFCSLYCPQWCYIIFPPPPPIEFPNDNSGPNFSPLVIAIIGILASAFLLVSYYAIISKYCGNMDSPRRRENHQPNEELEDNQEDPSTNIHEPWHIVTNGLDENLIKSITVCKYKKGDGLIDGTDCSVCLSEFEEDESVRLLPKCSHAFHVVCIDTWLKSHSNCPNCRANIIFVNASPIPLSLPVIEPPLNDENDNDENAVVSEDIETVVPEEEISRNEVVQKSQLRALSDLGCSKERDTIIEIIDEDSDKQIRRSVSMNYLCQSQVLIADVLRLKQDEEDFHIGSSTSRRPTIEMSKSCYGNRILHCVVSPIAMKRSFSSGRFSFSRRNRERNLLIPL